MVEPNVKIQQIVESFNMYFKNITSENFEGEGVFKVHILLSA